MMCAMVLISCNYACTFSAKLHRLCPQGMRVLVKVSSIQPQMHADMHTQRGMFIKRPVLDHRASDGLQVRTIVQPPQRFTPKHHADQVPKDYEMIYQSNIGKKHIRILFIIGFVAVGYIGLIAYFIFLFSGEWDHGKKFKLPMLDEQVSTLKFTLASSFVIFSVIWTGVTLKFSKLPVQRIYESSDKVNYIGILKKTALSTERVEFTLQDVTALPLKPGQVLRQGNAKIHGRPCLIYATDFKTTSYFNNFLGYDPPDLQKPK